MDKVKLSKAKVNNANRERVEKPVSGNGFLFQADITDGFYKAFVSSAMEGFFLENLDGYILDVNDAFCQMIGYSRDELLSMNIHFWTECNLKCRA